MDTITQAELKEYLKIKSQIESLEAALGMSRQSLIDRTGMGAVVEPGPLVLKVQPSKRADVNTKILVEEVAKKYGEAVAKELKTAATKQVEFSRVIVEEAS